MSQNDMVIDNQNFPSFRADLNNALQSLTSLSGGATAPSPVYDNMLWYDTATYTLKIDSNSTWAPVAFLNQSTNKVCLFSGTQVVDASGTQLALLGRQDTSVWNTGTGTTETMVSPAKVKSAVQTHGPQMFKSTAQTMANSTLITLAHGLGSLPDFVTLELTCTSVEAGYLVGDIIEIAIASEPDGLNEGVGVRKDATNLYIMVGDGGPAKVTNKSGGAGTALTASKWTMVARAVKFP